jgi:isoleucyl-tRNA synthetase
VPRGAAPLLPLIAEEVYRGLTGERSVHLDWPTGRKIRVRSTSRATSARPLATRKLRGARWTVAGATLAPCSDEVNVKDVRVRKC